METKELYESPMKDRNDDRYGMVSNTCICCGRPTNGDYYVHMSTCWVAIQGKYTEDDLKKEGMESQGLFPIGPSCAKKMGKKYIILA